MILGLKLVAEFAAASLTGVVTMLGVLRAQMHPRFPYQKNPLPDGAFEAMATSQGWSAQRLQVGADAELRGLLREPAAADRPWIIFFGGNSENVLAEGQQFIDALCSERGWGGVAWSYRGFDSTGGTPSPTALEEDGFAAYSKLLEERGVAPGSVHLVGFSLGTSIAAAVAARAHDQPPASLTLLAPMTFIYVGERSQLRLHRYETLKSLQAIASPTLVLHGLHDTALKVENGRAVASALGSRARFFELADVGHNELPIAPAAQKALREFIDEHHASAPGTSEA